MHLFEFAIESFVHIHRIASGTSEMSVSSRRTCSEPSRREINASAGNDLIPESDAQRGVEAVVAQRPCQLAELFVTVEHNADDVYDEFVRVLYAAGVSQSREHRALRFNHEPMELPVSRRRGIQRRGGGQ